MTSPSDDRIIDTSILTFYVDGSDKHRWRIMTKNGRIIGSSSQGYVDKYDAIKNVRQLCDEFSKLIAAGTVEYH
jgi:uncharacterized protein YegP (UPF0339 family)